LFLPFDAKLKKEKVPTFIAADWTVPVVRPDEVIDLYLQ